MSKSETPKSNTEYKVFLTKRAQHELDDLAANVRDLVWVRLLGLRTDPRPAGAEPVKGEPKGTYRVRQGDFRIVYSVDDAKREIDVTKIRDRKEVYRRR